MKGFDSRLSLLLSKQRSTETKASNTERPFLPVAVLIQLNPAGNPYRYLHTVISLQH